VGTSLVPTITITYPPLVRPDGSNQTLTDFLHLGGMVSYVSPRLVKMRDAPRKIPRTLSEFEVRQFLAAAYTLREIALVEFLYGTGCRVSEVSSLRLENIDFEARTARVSGKDRHGRVVLITERAASALQAYIGKRREGYVFQSDMPVQKLCVAKCNGQFIGQWKDYRGPGTRYVSMSKYLGSPRGSLQKRLAPCLIKMQCPH
jgi:integrase